MYQTLSKWWENTKAFFKNSETIFYARLQALAGLAVAVAGSVDWQTIGQLDWTTPKQTVWIGIGILANGIFTEILRRRNMNA